MPREQYEVHWKDYYEILQVHPRAEPYIITAAYRKLAQLYHPDRNNSPTATARFQEINGANEVLSDWERRAKYDEVYRAKQNGPASQSEPWQADAPRWTDREDDRDTGWEPTRTPPYETPRSKDEHSHSRSQETSASSAGFLSDLADRLAPDPDESQRILPWPSWQWQRLALLGSFPMALLSILISLPSAAWVLFALALAWLGGAIYAGATTRWLRATGQAPQGARIAGGTCIIASGFTYTVAVISIIVAAVLTVLFFRFAAAALKESLEKRR